MVTYSTYLQTDLITLSLTTSLTFHVSVNTKMSSAPMQRIRKRPSSSKTLTVLCEYKYQEGGK